MVRWLIILLWVCTAARAQEAGQALAVEVGVATRVAHERSLAADGVVAARELAAVNAQVAGVSLAKLNADIGDRVQAGQVLALFDTTLKQELAQAQAQEARAQAALAQAKRNAARTGKLVQERAVSVSDSEQSASAQREAQAVLDAGRALWRYYHAQPNANPNAALYDIRLHFQGSKPNGHMNPKSDDARYTELISTLRTALKALAKKIEPKVYEHGFLLG